MLLVNLKKRGFENKVLVDACFYKLDIKILPFGRVKSRVLKARFF